MTEDKQNRPLRPLVCTVEGCAKSIRRRGKVCTMHYTRMRRHGSYDTPLTPREKTLLNGEIRCAKCETLKSKNEFYEDGRTYSGYSPYCKSCNNIDCKKRRSEKTKETHRGIHLKASYGLSIQDYQTMLKDQNNACALCGRSEEYKALSVDHDHKTGKVRGLLCNKCNTALGFFQDNIETVSKALDYLKRFIE